MLQNNQSRNEQSAKAARSFRAAAANPAKAHMPRIEKNFLTYGFLTLFDSKK